MPTVPDSHRDLLDCRVAVLSTLGPRGFPESTCVWFLVEDGKIRLSLNTSRRKLENLRARPACSFLIPDPTNSNRYVELRANAVIAPDDDYAFADRVGLKYGTDLRSRDRPGEGRVVVTLEPVNVYPVLIGTVPAPW